MPEPAVTLSVVSSGGQAVAHAPVQVGLPPLSLSNAYSVMSLPSARMVPALVARALTSAGPVGAIDPAGGEDSGAPLAGGEDAGASVDGDDSIPGDDGWANPPEDGTALCLSPHPVVSKPRLVA